MEGAAGLTVERLCAASGKTRGSFYHHFADMDAFIVAILDRWRRDNTLAVIAEVETHALPNRLEALGRHVPEIDHELEVAVRLFAAGNSHGRDALAQVDEERIAYLARLYRAVPGLAPEDADDLAALEYSAFVGAQMLYPDDMALMVRLQQRFLEMVLPKRN